MVGDCSPNHPLDHHGHLYSQLPSRRKRYGEKTQGCKINYTVMGDTVLPFCWKTAENGTNRLNMRQREHSASKRGERL